MPQPIYVKKPQGHRVPSHSPSALAVALLTALAALPGASLAQEAAPARSPGGTPPAARPSADKKKAAPEAIELKTMIVNARQGQERAVDVPFGLSVLDGDEVEARRLHSVEEALRSAPGVEINTWGDPNTANVSIRGIGSLYQVSMDDGSVALNVDGVPMSVRSVSLGSLDADRIEVLKGSQGTLFGGNSIAGAINITTRKPTRHLEAYVRGEFGKDNEHLEETVVSGPLSESLSSRVALRNTGSDHWIENAQDGKPLSKPSNLAFRGSLLWDIAPRTNAQLTAEREKIKRSPTLWMLRPYDGDRRPYGDPAKVDATPGVFDDNRKTMDRYSLEVNHDLVRSRLTSITAYTTTDFFNFSWNQKPVEQAIGGPNVGETVFTTRSDEKRTSQELRLASLPGARAFWVTGLYLSRADRSYNGVTLTYRGYTIPYNYASDRNYTTNSQGVYGEMTYPLTKQWKLTTGLRHSRDRKEYDATYYSNLPAVKDKRKLDDAYTTGRLALSYAVTPGANLYGVFSRGYQSGGFSDSASSIATSEPYKPARSNALELGFKMEPSSHGLAVNGALFVTKVTDAHLLGFDTATNATKTINADTESKGAELEGTWHADSGFQLSAGMSYLKAEVTNPVLNVYGGDIQSGNRIPDIPHWSGNLGVAYRKAIPAFLGLSAPALNTRLGYRYVGARAADAQNHFDLRAYNKVDMRIGITSENSEIYAYGNNLTNEQYDLYGYGALKSGTSEVVQTGAPARGRAFGVGAAYYF